MLKKLSFKHTCNDDTGIGRRKLQKLWRIIFSHVNFRSRRYTMSTDHYVAAKATYIRLLHGKIGFFEFFSAVAP